LWHTGEVFSACLAELSNNIVGIDENAEVVNNLNKGIVPLKEPDLEKIVRRNIKNGQLKYSTDFKLLTNCDAMWITIDTPLEKEGWGDFSQIFTYIKKSLPYLKKGVLIIISSQLEPRQR